MLQLSGIPSTSAASETTQQRVPPRLGIKMRAATCAAQLKCFSYSQTVTVSCVTQVFMSLMPVTGVVEFHISASREVGEPPLNSWNKLASLSLFASRTC